MVGLARHSAPLVNPSHPGVSRHADPFRCVAIGTLNGSGDLSGLTGTLENGLAGNVLGRMGSGMAWAGGSTFLVTPDRGPNATPYNAAVDDTVSYISRFQTVDMTPAPSFSRAVPTTSADRTRATP